MKTTELVELLTTQDLSDAEAYNLLLEGVSGEFPREAVATLEGQQLIIYFSYQLREVCFPVMRKLREALRFKDAECDRLRDECTTAIRERDRLRVIDRRTS
jgi:hypothetical protein